MINIPPTRPSTSIKAEILPDITKIWKVNQLLHATTERGGDALSKVILRVGQHLVEARTPVPLKNGDQLQLLVKSLGNTPLLSIQTPLSQPAIAASKLRLFIAQQQSLFTFTAIAQQLTTQNKFPAPLSTLLNQLISAIPSSQQLLPAGKLKQLIQHSGVFLEAKLATKNTVNLHRDIKAQLIKISHAIQTPQITQIENITARDTQKIISHFIRGDISTQQLSQQLASVLSKQQLLTLLNSLKSLAQHTAVISKIETGYNLNTLLFYLQKHIRSKQTVETLVKSIHNQIALNDLKLAVDNALSAITSHQLMPLSKEADNLLLLLFGLFVKDKEQINLIDFKIEQDENNTDNNDIGWTVTINFKFNSLGKFQVRVHLLKTQVSTVFTVENSATVNLINRNLERLDNALQKLGFSNINIDVIQNTVNDVFSGSGHIQIVDEQA
jgi:hypothetical protein